MTFLDALRELQTEYEQNSKGVHEHDNQVPLINAALAQFCQRLLDKAALAEKHAAASAMATRSPSDTSPIKDTDIVWFGKYKGTPFGDVPMDYWTWLRSQPQPIKHVELKDYVTKRLAAPTSKVAPVPPREKDPDGIPF